MRKRKAIEHVYLEGETPVGDIDDVSIYEDPDLTGEFKDKVEMERLIYFLTAEEIMVLLLRHLGYKSEEIYKIMGLHSVSKYYKFYHNMKMRIYLFKTFSGYSNEEKY